MFAAVDHAIGTDAKALAVAMTFGVHIARGVRIVRRHTAIEVESQNLAVVTVVVLGRDAAVSHVARAHQQCVVGQNQQTASVVDASRAHDVEDLLVAEGSPVPVEDAQPFVVAVGKGLGGVGQIHQRLRFKVGMQGHAQQPGFHA